MHPIFTIINSSQIKVNLPSSCVHILPGGPMFCDREKNCESDAECAKAGQNCRLIFF